MNQYFEFLLRLVPAGSTAVLFAAVLWFYRNLIATWITWRVSHQYDIKLENLRSEFREKEETLRVAIQLRETEVALRNGALPTFTSRQIALDQRRMLSGEETDQASMKNTADILRLSREIMTAANKAGVSE
jgi:hypothetical protein